MMNVCLANIGIHDAEHRDRALVIGEAMGIYRDYPVSEGRSSPFVPIWINAMVSRQKAQRPPPHPLCALAILARRGARPTTE